MPTAALLLVLLACTDDPGADTAGAEDAFPDPPEGGMQLITPELEIPPYTEKEYCWFGTYEGATVGLHASQGFQAEGGHHVLMLGTNYLPEEHPDGELIDCTEKDSIDMLRMEPLFIQGSYDPAYAEAASLPPGMAIELKQDQRWIVQTHYINTTGETLLARDALNMAFLEEEEVETWAATLAHSTIGIDLPPGQETSVTVDCEIEEELHLLNISGHMHEHGTSFSAVLQRDGVSETLYEVPQWTAEYRDDAPMTDFGADPLALHVGDRLLTTCTWFNDSETALGFPAEMCATTGVAWPLRSASTCVEF